MNYNVKVTGVSNTINAYIGDVNFTNRFPIGTLTFLLMVLSRIVMLTLEVR